MRYINMLVKGKSGNLLVQLMRYFVSGGVAFVVDTSLLYALTEYIGLHYMISTILSYSVGLVITYIFSIWWVFDKRSLSNQTMEFSIFALIGVSGLALTSLFMWIFTSGIEFHYIVSKIITTVLVFIWNFVLKKVLLFRNK